MEAAGSTAAGARAVPKLGAARRRYGEDVIKALLILAALISVLTTTGIVIALLRETLDFFGSIVALGLPVGRQVDAALRAGAASACARSWWAPSSPRRSPSSWPSPLGLARRSS